MGSAEAEAHEVADHLMRANLAGHDSHGIGMLPAYVRLLKAGLLIPNQTPETVLDFGALLVLDARRGFGQRMAARRCAGRSPAPARLGACVLGLRNASISAASAPMPSWRLAAGCRSRLRQCRRPSLRAGAVGCRDRGSAPTRSVTALPGPEGPVLMLDMATTAVAGGKVRVAYNMGKRLPEGS